MSGNSATSSGFSQVIGKHEKELLADWVQEQLPVLSRRGIKAGDAELKKECSEFLALLRNAVEQSAGEGIESAGWNRLKEMLQQLSRTRGAQGYSPSETASFVFSLKKPVFAQLRRELSGDGSALADETWLATSILDRLGLYTTEVYQKAREEVIRRQQEEMLELSTPVVKLWDGILALPMIGTLDSARTQIVMETPACRRSSKPARRSPSSTSRAFRRSTRSRLSICSRRSRRRV